MHDGYYGMWVVMVRRCSWEEVGKNIILQDRDPSVKLVQKLSSGPRVPSVPIRLEVITAVTDTE